MELGRQVGGQRDLHHLTGLFRRHEDGAVEGEVTRLSPLIRASRLLRG